MVNAVILTNGVRFYGVRLMIILIISSFITDSHNIGSKQQYAAIQSIGCHEENSR